MLNQLDLKNSLVTVGIGEMKISRNMKDVIVTYALGSCIALTLYDPLERTGGMIHCKLPKPGGNIHSACNPAIFVNPGVLHLYQSLVNLGVDSRRLIAKIFGCANVIDNHGIFNIGEQNYVEMVTILGSLNIQIKTSRVGGTTPRTVYLHLAEGKTIVRSRNHSETV